MTTVYGIKNCDTMKKALRWLETHNIGYRFHDYKKDGAPPDILLQAMAAHGWENVINRRGTSWRKLPEDVRENMDEGSALRAAQDNPSLIRRPLMRHQDAIYLGFTPETYNKIF